MISSFQLTVIELRQSKIYFILIFLISFLLGTSFCLSIKANGKIAELSDTDSWDADLVIVPKGVSLNDLRQELVSATTTAFLPEALFETTMSLANNLFKLTAVLAITDETGARLMIKSNFETIGISWLRDHQKIARWNKQTKYKTPEWDYKVITAFFASGSAEMMKSLKELVDKKTVGQALYIKQQQAHDEKIKDQLSTALYIYTGVLIQLIFLSFFSLIFWVKSRLNNSLNIFFEVGFPASLSHKLIFNIFTLTVILPLFLATFISSFISIWI